MIRKMIVDDVENSTRFNDFFLVISLQFLTYYSNSQNLVFEFKVSYDPSFFYVI